MSYFGSVIMRIPPYLKPGDIIGLSATARFATTELINQAHSVIEAHGFRVFFNPNILTSQGQVAGNLSDRIAHFNELVHRPEVKAIWNVRGGYGSAEIVDAVDWEHLKKFPKWLVGFSDFTTFLTHALHQGIASLHAPMPVSFSKTHPPCLTATFKALTTGEDSLPSHYKTPQTFTVAGNLSVIYSILGTPSLPNLKGATLILEDLDEYHYHLDRMLLSMKRRGDLKGLHQVILSSFTDIHDHQIPWAEQLDSTLKKHFESEGIPVFQESLIGHGSVNWPIILQQHVRSIL